MTRAFQKEGVSRNAVAQVAPVAELYFADSAQFDTLTFTSGKLTEFDQMCKERMTGDIQTKVTEMKR